MKTCGSCLLQAQTCPAPLSRAAPGAARAGAGQRHVRAGRRRRGLPGRGGGHRGARAGLPHLCGARQVRAAAARPAGVRQPAAQRALRGHAAPAHRPGAARAHRLLCGRAPPAPAPAGRLGVLRTCSPSWRASRTAIVTGRASLCMLDYVGLVLPSAPHAFDYNFETLAPSRVSVPLQKDCSSGVGERVRNPVPSRSTSRAGAVLVRVSAQARSTRAWRTWWTS